MRSSGVVRPPLPSRSLLWLPPSSWRPLAIPDHLGPQAAGRGALRTGWEIRKGFGRLNGGPGLTEGLGEVEAAVEAWKAEWQRRCPAPGQTLGRAAVA